MNSTQDASFLDDGKTKVALVVCDLLGFHRSLSVEARRLAKEATGIPTENILISCTHTHSAGTALGEQIYYSDAPLDPYNGSFQSELQTGLFEQPIFEARRSRICSSRCFLIT